MKKVLTPIIRLLCPAILFMITPVVTIAIDLADLSIESVESESIRIRDLRTEFEFQDVDQLQVRFQAGSITVVDLGELVDVAVRCNATLLNDATLMCSSGTVSAVHEQLGAVTGSLSFHLRDDYRPRQLAMDLQIGSTGSLKAGYSHDNSNTELHIDADHIALQPFVPLLQSRIPALADHDITSGVVGGMARLNGTTDRFTVIEAEIKLNDFSLEGANVLEQTDLAVSLNARRENDNWLFNSDARVVAGVMYLIPGFEVFDDSPGFYIDATEEGLQLALTGRVETGFSKLALESFAYSHGDLLHLKGRALIELADSPFVEHLELYVDALDLAGIYPVYVQPLLLPTNFADLDLAGALQLDLRYAGNELTRLGLQLKDVYLDDDLQRFSVSGLNSDLFIGESQQMRVSSLDWGALSLYKIIFGTGDITLLSGKNRIEVVDWQDVDLLDGRLLINQLALSGIGSDDFSLSLHGELTPISLKNFTQTMGWPLMSGRLSGIIEDFEYRGGDLRINGDLKFRVFDGDVILQGLVIENLFERNARFYTDVVIDNLDLEQVTGTFSFGRIEGSLDGHIRKLTLLDWQPVYFDAVLKSPDDDERPHRISQKALDNLSEIGGGLSGALSKGFLRFVDEYSYGRLGLRCLLSNGVCNLGGIEQTGDGFYIMTRGGLLPPWVDVKATGRSIIWKDLVNGLKRIAEGEIAFE